MAKILPLAVVVAFFLLSAINYGEYRSRVDALNAPPRSDAAALMSAIAPGSKTEYLRGIRNTSLAYEAVLVIAACATLLAGRARARS
ncbi:MAG: hypothetical protein M3T49_02560 [Candidatus Eremiobacteraeota bacterium]|nr:hypothetical protein [Candidatus Eremiobacteraeota bacterium]